MANKGLVITVQNKLFYYTVYLLIMLNKFNPYTNSPKS